MLPQRSSTGTLLILHALTCALKHFHIDFRDDNYEAVVRPTISDLGTGVYDLSASATEGSKEYTLSILQLSGKVDAWIFEILLCD